MKKSLGLLLMLSLLLLGACSDESDYRTKEEAMEAGLRMEEVDQTSVLSIERYKGESFVFYKIDGALGVASIEETTKGYAWKRYPPYHRVEVNGDLPYSTTGFNLTTYAGVEVSILVGKVFNDEIESVTLAGDVKQRVLEVDKDSGLFYAIHDVAYEELEIIE